MKIDDSEKSPGWKFSEQEMLGIPTRIEIGPKDIENNQVVVVRRDTREKIVVSMDEMRDKIRRNSGNHPERICLRRAKAHPGCTYPVTATSMEEMISELPGKTGLYQSNVVWRRSLRR